jgi:hypothetical protein
MKRRTTCSRRPSGDLPDVLQSTNEGTEQFSGGTVTPNMLRFLGCPPCWAGRCRRTMRAGLLPSL